METKKHKVTAFFRQNYCDCGGKLVKGTIAVLTDPIKIEHTCDTCGVKEHLLEKDMNGVAYEVDMESTI